MGVDIFQEKLQLFRDAREFKKTKTAPVLANISGWAILESKYHFKEVYYNWRKLKEIYIEFGQRYDFDAYVMNGAIYNFPFLEALGGGAYMLHPETGAISVADRNLIFPEEYEEYAEDPNKFNRKAFARKYPNLTTPKFQQALEAVMDLGRYQATVDAEVFKKKIKRPLMNTLVANVMAPIEILNSGGLRGIKDLSIDLRRHREKMDIVFEACWQKTQHQSLLKNVQEDRSDYVCDMYTALLAHAFLSVKQFEQLYWPYLKQIIDATVQAGKTIFIFSESEMLRFCEFFQDIPKGAAILHVENDDIYEVRKKLPNICLAGGLPIEKLGYGTPQQCVDAAKKLIDDMGEGYILSTTKIAAYRDDIRRENLLALLDFVHQYDL
jgi:hypothetical protein